MTESANQAFAVVKLGFRGRKKRVRGGWEKWGRESGKRRVQGLKKEEGLKQGSGVRTTGCPNVWCEISSFNK